MNTELDHLVVLARTLDEGAAWCEATLGVVPGPGGRHALMGTHNRLLSIASPGFERAYLEVLAIDPQAPAPGRPRWFGLDDPAQQAALAQGPQLAHAVLRTGNVEMLRWGLVNLGCQPGVPLALERPTPQGPLRWRILVRDDGAQDLGGALPTLIEWQGPHPADHLPASPVQVLSARFSGLKPGLRTLLRLRGATWDEAGPRLAVTLQTPRGVVTLQAAG